MDQRETAFSQDTQAAEDSLETAAGDRRRPGRQDQVTPTLIPLLRGALAHGLTPEDRTGLEQNRGDMSAASGGAVILALSAALWGAIGCAVWAILR